MRVSYKFKVDGQFRLTTARTMAVDPALVSVELTSENVLECVVFTYRLPPDAELPSLPATKSPGAKFAVNFPSYEVLEHALFLASNLKDNLCVFGIDRIDTEHFETEWIPENEIERKRLVANNIKSEYGVPNQAFALWRSSMFREALTKGHADDAFRTQLTFFRSAFTEHKRFAYAASFMHFFFFFESLYGDNAVKSRPLATALGSANEFTTELEASAEDEPKDSPYRSQIPSACIARLISRRGELLHNQAKKQRTWGRSLHDEYRHDASFLCKVASRIAMRRLWPKGVPPGSAVHDAMYDAVTRYLSSE